jgi:hypothetical protein
MKNEKSNVRFLHLLDHIGGTISNLISPLGSYPEHQILTSSFDLKKTMNLIKEISKNEDISVILHSTGNKKPFYNKKEDIFKRFKKSYMFLHVSPIHFLIKDRLKEIENIEKLVNKDNFEILTPSKGIKKELSYYGINSKVMQLGVIFRPEEYKLDKKEDKKYIITVCTSGEGIYHYIKGVDRFYRIVKELGLENQSIVLGNGSALFKDIKSKKLTPKNFIKYLCKSKAYVQFSRTESYNLSAVYAKLLKVPIVVSNIEGHIDNVKYGFRTNNMLESKKVLENILQNPNDPQIKKIINKNYKDSIKRENLNNFKNLFNQLVNL